MKLRRGLTNLDLASRFRISCGTVSKTIITWINYLYIQLGLIKIWPDRKIILQNHPEDFHKDYPNTLIILKIQCPSSLVLQSATYSSYKSTNTLKGLVGVDAKGGFMFVSQLYTGTLSDKELVKRCGLLSLLRGKINTSEINIGDCIMADKGFNIEKEINELGLQLNIPPFLQAEPRFSEMEVIRTQTVAKHRIHVERAIGKVKCFKIFYSPLSNSLMGTVNQIWTVCCLISNFLDNSSS